MQNTFGMDISLQDIFVNNLKFYRKRQNLTQEALSERLGKGLSYINKIESKSSFPTIQVIEEISNLLEIKPYLLFCDTETLKNVVLTKQEDFIEKLSISLSKHFSDDLRNIIKTEFL